jgi:4-hydroxybenzoyl-CoA thioesterase
MTGDPGPAAAPRSFADGRVFEYAIEVKFGDCDPAGIVYYPNFYRWFDEGVHAAARACGWSWERTSSEFGWLGLPLAEAGASFRRPVGPGDRLVLETRLAALEERRLVFGHRIRRGDILICEGFERRFVGVLSDETPPRVRAIEVPAALVQALTEP